jgi:sucrose-phosphate synthase
MARPDERKNFATLLRAFGSNADLRERANLVLVIGTRDDIEEMPSGARRVLTQILLLIDRYDLYGSVAYPKAHTADDVPALFRMAAASGGVFVNPALTEPFGLTLIEAAASGLPVVATNDGGPQDIVAACQNGVLVDPLDPEAMGRQILETVEDRDRWHRWSRSGIKGARDNFSWTSHGHRYLEEIRETLGSLATEGAPKPIPRVSKLTRVDRILVTDIDNTLTGNPEALEAFFHSLEEAGQNVGFAVATGRPLPMAIEVLDELGVHLPDILISATGTEIHYGDHLVPDRSWRRQIDYHWEPKRVTEVLLGMGGLLLLDDEPPTPFRVRFRREHAAARKLAEIRRTLRGAGLRVTVTLDRDTDLDITPMRASPGLAIRFLSYKWDLPPHRFLVAGDSGNDADMLAGDTLGVVVQNHSPELEALRDRPRIFFSEKDHAWGVLDGIEHYDFFGSIRIPEPTEPPRETNVA